MEYPIFIKSTNDYIMYKYRRSGALEITAIDYDFKQLYVGYGRQQAVRLFRQALKETVGK
tara:strand:- start:1653 stop:1832 length:180 start_codon:yes stop_codon:yes gene_type:complete